VRVFSYIVRVDNGVAPNPFHGTCTLACCKPVIRRRDAVGDLVVGLSARGEFVIYAMQVASAVTFADYWRDAQYTNKRPDWNASDLVAKCGDNIYRPVEGGYAASRSAHHPGPAEDRAVEHPDLDTDRVLIAHRFCYFGAQRIPLPKEIEFLRVGRGHRSRFTRQQVATTAAWFVELPQGRHGVPSGWPADSAANVHDDVGRSNCARPVNCDR
jgi:hypothetical protein